MRQPIRSHYSGMLRSDWLFTRCALLVGKWWGSKVANPGVRKCQKYVNKIQFSFEKKNHSYLLVSLIILVYYSKSFPHRFVHFFYLLMKIKASNMETYNPRLEPCWRHFASHPSSNHDNPNENKWRSPKILSGKGKKMKVNGKITKLFTLGILERACKEINTWAMEVKYGGVQREELLQFFLNKDNYSTRQRSS